MTEKAVIFQSIYLAGNIIHIIEEIVGTEIGQRNRFSFKMISF